MAVSLRVTGTWAELTADGPVVIPATPQAGDRMFLFARWKDFSVTATVADWTELAEFADGAVSSGNGSGSVKVGCWYRDWQPGDTDPTIDFSAAPENASVVIQVWQKGADDVWQTPIAKTAAMTNWTTSSQIVAASATAVVPSGAVVMGLIGIRDDTATMTRPTTGIDDSAGAITWNGDYVESPATHHSTTTGDDGATDLGYRLVATGGTATLRMTGTISAAETGAALWVVQGVSTLVIPGNATLTSVTFGPTLNLKTTPSAAALITASFSPKLALTLTPSTTNLSVTSLAPVLNLKATSSSVSLTLSSFAPKLHEQITPSVVSFSVATFAPVAAVNVVIVPSTATLIITPQTASLNYVVNVPQASLVISTFAPSILPFNIIFLDPGGDAVQAIGHFNTISGAGTASFDNTQQFEGVGSYKFDSGAGGDTIVAAVTGVLSHDTSVFSPRRFSCYFRYDSVPDASEIVEELPVPVEDYSGGGFDDSGVNLSGGDDGGYSAATPAKNAGQGTVFGSFGFGPNGSVPIGAAIDSVKVIYERKYDVDTSEGISRVKYRIDGIEGPDYDNTDMPLTDTVVTVELTDRGFTREDLLDGIFEVIVEARRGDTDTEHTQSWDYVKVEVEWHLDGIIAARDSADLDYLFLLGLSRKGDGAVLRFIDGLGASFLGITQLLPDTWNRISFAYIQRDTVGVNDLDIDIFVNGIQELSLTDLSTDGVAVFNLFYGWLDSPGVDHLCWFDQIYIDDGDDLSDPGNKLSTYKGPASNNEDNWSTTGGNGAVNERPLSLTNFRQHSPSTGARQSYTLQAASVGDVDLTGKTLVGYMVWAWAKTTNNVTVEEVYLIANGVDVDRTLALANGTNGVPLLLKSVITSATYPSDAAGVGMTGNLDTADVFIYELGAVVAYEGPAEESILPYQLLVEDSITNLTDDLRADPPESYELCYRIDESAANVLITIYSISAEGQEPQLQGTVGGQSGGGRLRIKAGIEVQVAVEVTGGSARVAIWHRINFD